MTKSFSKDVLYEAISKEKAEARKNGKVAGFGESVTAKQMLAGSIAVVNSAIVETESNPTEEQTAEETVPPAAQSPEPVPQPETSLTLDSVRGVIDAVVAPIQNELNQTRSQLAETEQTRSQLEEQLKTVVAERDRYLKDVRTFQDIGKLYGVSEFPNVNTTTKIDSDTPKGDWCNELLSILNDRDKSKIHENVAGYSPTTGTIYATQRDPRSAGEHIQKSFREARAKGLSWKDSAIVREVEAWAKNNGLLSGRVINAAGPTTGATGSVASAFLDILSAIMRETHSQSNIFWQFTIVAFDSTSAPGKNILVPRFNALPAPTTLSDYLMANTTTYNTVGLPIGSGTDSQNLEMTTVPIACSQWGIGRGNTVNTRPIFIPEFHQATSLVDLMDAVETRLMRNYYQFEELLIRTEYEKATTVVYNDRNAVTSVPADVAVGDGGDMTREFLTSVYSSMYAAQIPTFPDGTYSLALNPTASGQLKQSYDKIIAPPTQSDVEELSNMFRQTTGLDIGRVSNYIGFSPDGFHLFVGNSFGVGSAGAAPTVQNTTFAAGVGSQVTNDSFAFGPGCVGRGIALPAEIRSQDAPFQLGTGYIWTERGGAAPMDLDSTLDTSQQTRCWKLRTARRAV